MNKTRIIVLGALLAALAALFQLIPYFFSEMLVLLTIFSGLPIYIISRIKPKVGVLSYIVASAIIIFFTLHEGLFFLCTNGIIGLSLGICNYYTKRKSIIWIISSFYSNHNFKHYELWDWYSCFWRKNPRKYDNSTSYFIMLFCNL